MIVVKDANLISIEDAYNNENESYSFEVNEIFLKKYHYGINYYVDRLKKGATAGVRGKTDVTFRESVDINGKIKKEFIKNLEGGQINIAMSAFLAQAYSEFLNDKLKRKPLLKNKTLVGFDTRYYSEDIARMITRILAGNNFFIYRNKNRKPSPTPVNSLLTYILGCAGSLNITASHNPADQNGIKPNNEKGHLDSDDDLELFLKFVLEIYDYEKGPKYINIAPYGVNMEEIDFSEIYLKQFINLMIDDGFIDKKIIQDAIETKERKWGFVIDGIGGTGGSIMEETLDALFENSWRKSIIIINKEYDPNMLGIPKPDPTIPSVMKASGLLDRMSENPDVSAGGTGDNDWDRFTSAIKISEGDIPKAKKAGLYVPSEISPPLAQFTADQMYTFFGEYQLRRIAQERYYALKGKKPEIYDKEIDKAIKTRYINLSDCHIVTTYPSSIQSNYLVKYYGATLIYTSVGFKNIGITVSTELEKKIEEDNNFKPIYVLGKEESGGNGFGFPKGAKIGPDGRYWLGAKDKDTTLNVLKLMEISADAFLVNKTIVDLYSEMLDRLDVLTFYERVDWYIKDKSTLKPLDNVKYEIAKKADDLESPEGAIILANLFHDELVNNEPELVFLNNSYLWAKVASNDALFSDGSSISKGDLLFNRVYDDEEKKPANVDGEWLSMPVKINKYKLKSGRYFTVFHAGEGPKINLYDNNDNPIYWTLIRPSGTEEGLIRHYNEIVCDKHNADPWLLADYAKPFMEYFGVMEYYDGDDFLQLTGEKSLTKILYDKYGKRKY